MIASREILCIGSVLWDVIGRTPSHMRQGSDVPGRITRLPGGVALNIAMALARNGARPILLSAVGRDDAGDELIARCRALGCETDHVYRADDLPTDQYMAVEAGNGLIAAIADAHSLERAGAKILRPLSDGRIARPAAPFAGIAALDGNLMRSLLEEIATGDMLAHADLRIASASPDKADRLLPFLSHESATLYLNLHEARFLCQSEFAGSPEAAAALLARGAKRVVVTDGAAPVSDGDASGILTQTPPEVHVTRITGAGDTFMAAHITAEAEGRPRAAALDDALRAAARYISGDPSP